MEKIKVKCQCKNHICCRDAIEHDNKIDLADCKETPQEIHRLETVTITKKVNIPLERQSKHG
jgi:hypothetical protein